MGTVESYLCLMYIYAFQVLHPTYIIKKTFSPKILPNASDEKQIKFESFSQTVENISAWVAASGMESILLQHVVIKKHTYILHQCFRCCHLNASIMSTNAKIMPTLSAEDPPKYSVRALHNQGSACTPSVLHHHPTPPAPCHTLSILSLT